MTINYNQINSLEDVVIFANSDFTFYYTFLQDDGITPFNLTGATVTLVMCPFGQEDNTVLQIDATITDAANGECNVAIAPGDTSSMVGRYIQQPVIVKSGKTYRPAQGIVLVVAGITVSGG